MKIRFALVAALAAATTLPAADLQVAAGTTFSISGFLAVGTKYATVQNTVRPGLVDEVRVDDNTSRIFFSGSSKIADGYNAVFQIGSRFTTDVRPGDTILNGNTLTVSQGTGWADDDTWAGIATPYGRIIFGKNSFYWADGVGLPHLAAALDSPGENYKVWDVQGLSTFTILDQAVALPATNSLANVYTLGITRSRNVIRYDSPNFKGVDFSVAWTKNAVGGEYWYPGTTTPNAAGYARGYENGGTTYARIRYNGNGITAFLAVLDQKLQGGIYAPAAFTGPNDVSAYRMGVGYKLPMGLKLGATFDHTEIANGVSGTSILTIKTFGSAAVATATGISKGKAQRDAFMLTASYPYGDHTFHATYAKAGDTSSIADTGANQFNLAWDYALNKKTFIGLEYTKLSNDSNGHYAPFLTNYNFGASNPNPAGYNGEGFSQWQLGLHFWF